MSAIDLYADKAEEFRSDMPGAGNVDPGIWGGFMRGTGNAFMRGTFEAAAGVDSILLSQIPLIADKVKSAIDGGPEQFTERDAFYKSHNEFFGEHIKRWTPPAGDVGVAGQVTGELLAALPQLLASPTGFVALQQMRQTERLAQKGVDPERAVAAGTVIGLGNAIGVYVPILGKTLLQRALIGGAGFNVVQGVATRAAASKVLEGTPAKGDFDAVGGVDLTLDALFGVVFGWLTHVTRARMPNAPDAVAALRQAQHVAADSMPGRPLDPIVDGQAHVNRLLAAVEQITRDEPVNVEHLPPVRMEADATRDAARETQVAHLQSEAETLRKAEGLPTVESAARALPAERHAVTSSTDATGAKWKVETVAIEEGTKPLYFKITDAEGRELAHADFVEKDGRISAESVRVNEDLRGRGIAEMLYRAATERTGMRIEPGRMQTPDGAAFVEAMQGKGVITGGKPKLKSKKSVLPETEDPMAAQAMRVAADNPDMLIQVGTDADGKPINQKLSDYLRQEQAMAQQAADDVPLFQLAAECLLGAH